MQMATLRRTRLSLSPRSIRRPRLWWAVFLYVMVLIVSAGPAVAQEEESAAIEEAEIRAELSEDGNDSVEIAYTIQNTGALEDGAVEHVLLMEPGTQVTDISAEGDVEGEPSVNEGEGLSRVTVRSSGDPSTYTLRYMVSREEGTFTVPVLAPDLPMAGPGRNVSIEAVLPEGERAAGERFPSGSTVESRNGQQVLTNQVTTVPTKLLFEYGQSDILNLTNVVTVIALVVIGAVLLIGYRDQAKGEES